MNTRSIIAITLSAGTTVLPAGPRTSASYTIATESIDAAGKRTASASYSNDGSAGGVTGISTVISPAESDKAGYIAQLFDVTGLTITAASPTVNETATDQLAAFLTLDDATTLSVPAVGVTWSVLNGPLTGISSGGLAMAGTVYQNTPATAWGLYSGFTGTLGLTVTNTLPDNFQTYATDGLADDWQVQYFGVNNPSAAPALDPDGDGFDNLFEYNACLIPTDPLSLFTMTVNNAPSGGHSVTFSPRLPGCTYALLGSSNLSLWTPVSGAISDAGTIRTVFDPAGNGPRRYYRLNVQRE